MKRKEEKNKCKILCGGGDGEIRWHLWGIWKQEDFRQGEQDGYSGTSKHFDVVWQRQECKHWQTVQLSNLKCLDIWRETDTHVEVNGLSSWWSLEQREKSYMISVQTISTPCSQMQYHSTSIDMNRVIVWNHIVLLFAIASHIIGLFRILEKLSNVNIFRFIRGYESTSGLVLWYNQYTSELSNFRLYLPVGHCWKGFSK